MTEIAPLIKIAPFHTTFLLIWKAPTHFEWTVGGTSCYSFLVLHIFKDSFAQNSISSATNSKILSITTTML